MRQCTKPNCYKQSIPRGKFCEEHRSNKRRRIHEESCLLPSENEEKKDTFPNEDSLLIQEQKREYEDAMMVDMARMYQESIKKRKEEEKDIIMDIHRHELFSYEERENS